jgi:hypothetical protein
MRISIISARFNSRESFMGRNTYAGLGCSLLIVAFLVSSPVLAIDAVADSSQNPRWHCSDKSGVATYLAGDKAESAVLVLNKAKVLGQTLTVTSDASYIVLQSGDSPHVTFQIPANPDGTASKILMTGGDQPTLFFNDKEQVQQQGKFIQVVTASNSTITLTLGTTTFAKVKFEAPATPAAAAPVEKPASLAETAGNRELLKPVTASQLLNVVKAFDQGINKKCPGCSGTGKVKVQVRTGSQQQGMYSVPVFETQEKKCEKCNGSGIDRSKDEVLIKLAGSMVKDLAALKKTDPKAQTTLTEAYDEITKDMIGDQKTWTSLTKNGRSILAQSSPAINTTVVALVEVKKSVPREKDERRYLVRVLGTDKEVYVDNPALADEVKSGRALMGGMVDDPILSGKDGKKTTVLRGGFLIAPQVTHDWWWWYRD